MSSIITNEKTFTLINRVSKTFSLGIKNFAYAATLLFRIRDRIRLTFSPVFAVGLFSTISLRRVRLLFSQMKLITKITQTISLRRIRITYIFRQKMASFVTIFSRIRMTIISSARQKLVSSIIIKKITLAITPTLAQFFTLGDYDPDTLGTLDTLTLGDMDYTT